MVNVHVAFIYITLWMCFWHSFTLSIWWWMCLALYSPAFWSNLNNLTKKIFIGKCAKCTKWYDEGAYGTLLYFLVNVLEAPIYILVDVLDAPIYFLVDVLDALNCFLVNVLEALNQFLVNVLEAPIISWWICNVHRLLILATCK